MSKQDYEKFAAMFAGEMSLARHMRNNAAVLQVRHIIASTADIFAQANPRFDREKFYQASDFHDA